MKIACIFLFVNCVCAPISAQIPTVSLIKAVEQCIAETEHSDIDTLRLGQNYYIEDIVSGQSITTNKSGIFEFGLYGENAKRWILWSDSTGFRIYGQNFNVNMLGEILMFLQRNKYSKTTSYHYIEKLYMSCKDIAKTL